MLRPTRCAAGRSRRRRRAAASPGATAGPTYLAPDVGETIARISDIPAGPAEVDETTGARPRSRRGLWAAVGAGAFLVLVAVVVAVSVPAMLSGGADPKASPSSTIVKPVDPIPVDVAPPTAMTGVKKGDEIVCTWKNTDRQEGDTFLWQDVTRADAPVARTPCSERP